MGKFYGLFFYSCALSFKVVWFTVPMEKRQLLLLLPLPVQCKETTSLPVSCDVCPAPFPGPALKPSSGRYQYTLSLCTHR